MNKKTKAAFTLIELLVVVLIIGILAAVAGPQYQKAVKKARFTEWATTTAAFTKALDLFILSNGWQDELVYFSGDKTKNYNFADLDIDMPWEKHIYGTSSVNKIGSWNSACHKPAEGNVCYISVNTANSSRDPNWLGGLTLTVKKYAGEQKWKLSVSNAQTDDNAKLICQYWATHYGTDTMYDNIKTVCAALGIE